MTVTKRRSADIRVGEITNFSGGPNFRDSPTELTAVESYSAYNVTFDERGGVQSRLGYTKRNPNPLGVAGDKIVNDFYSKLLGLHITQSGAKIYRADNTVAVHTFTTNACVTFTEFNGEVVAVHPVDGIWASPDATTWTKVTPANAPTTNTLCVATWQARLWVGLTDGSVHWSDPGTLNSWTAGNFNEIWEKDQQPVIALHVGSGQDIQGRPGLLVFKQDSVYRINDATTGAYTSIDTTSGAAGPKAVVGVGSRVCWIGKHGIFWWREDQAGPVNASDLLRPIWRAEALNFSTQNGWAAGRLFNRARFSCASNGSGHNDLAFEFHPDEGWITPRSDAMSCYATETNNDETITGGSPTVDGQAYVLDTGGTDDGAAITGWFQTRWLVPNGGFQTQVWQIRLHGRGSGTMTFRADYEDTSGSSRSFDLSGSAAAWGGFVWGSFTWTGTNLAETEAFSGFGVCREFSLRFDFTVNATSVGRTLFGSVPASTVGEFGLYSAQVSYIPMGLS